MAVDAGGGAHCTAHPPASPSTRCPPTHTGKTGVCPGGHAAAPAAQDA